MTLVRWMSCETVGNWSYFFFFCFFFFWKSSSEMILGAWIHEQPNCKIWNDTNSHDDQQELPIHTRNLLWLFAGGFIGPCFSKNDGWPEPLISMGNEITDNCQLLLDWICWSEYQGDIVSTICCYLPHS